MRTALERAADALWASLMELKPPVKGEPSYAIDADNRPALNALSAWLVNAPCKFTVNGAGIMLSGPVGTGKTMLMRALARAMQRGGGDGFTVVSAKKIVAEYESVAKDDARNGGAKVILRYANMEDLCIDELGDEVEGKYYGSTRNVLAEIIGLRYEKWTSPAPVLTHCTTNVISREMMLGKYDERTVSRLYEMTRVVPVTGKDRRADSKPSEIKRPQLFADEPTMPPPSPEEIEERKRRDKALFDSLRDAAKVTTERIDQPATT